MTGRCIAMWSGPRNISTAMMRAWENRTDTAVIDEPFYAHFLETTGIDHPMSDQIITGGETDWRKVAELLTQTPEQGIFYQKHISTHWMQHFSCEWLDGIEHVFLIREPEPVVASYANKRLNLTVSDLGYSQQAELFDLIFIRTGRHPPVIDSRRFLESPEMQLRKLCERLGIEFQANMLHWPAGSRLTDGIWESHWYDAVRKSTGFGPVNNKPISLDDEQTHIAQMCRPHYDALACFAL
jgi:hypothetical protein